MVKLLVRAGLGLWVGFWDLVFGLMGRFLDSVGFLFGFW